MRRIEAVVALTVAVYFIVGIVRHMIRPAVNAEYTRVLMFAGLATIPFVFLVGFTGGHDRWPHLIDYAREIAGESAWASCSNAICSAAGRSMG